MSDSTEPVKLAVEEIGRACLRRAARPPAALYAARAGSAAGRAVEVGGAAGFAPFDPHGAIIAAEGHEAREISVFPTASEGYNPIVMIRIGRLIPKGMPRRLPRVVRIGRLVLKGPPLRRHGRPR